MLVCISEPTCRGEKISVGILIYDLPSYLVSYVGLGQNWVNLHKVTELARKFLRWSVVRK